MCKTSTIRKIFKIGVLFHYIFGRQLKNYGKNLSRNFWVAWPLRCCWATPCWGNELTGLYIKRCLFNHSVHGKLFFRVFEIAARQRKKKVGKKKFYHIFMGCVSKEIGNQQSWKLSPVTFLEVLLLKVNLVMLI